MAESGLHVPRHFNQLRLRPTERVQVLLDGTRVRVTVDDSGTVTQLETGDALHAVVRPRAVLVRIPRVGG